MAAMPKRCVVRIDPVALADPAWRDRMRARGPVPTHDLAEIGDGFTGLPVPSIVRGAQADAVNLVL